MADQIAKTIFWIVPVELTGLRLDRALATHPEIQSRSRAARLLELKKVRSGDRKLKASQLVVAGEVYVVELPQAESSNLEPLNLKLDVAFEDESLLVVNKPAGLVVHPAAGHAQDTLVNALIHHTPQLAMGFGEQRPGIVHRLDKDTSGLLVVAKTDEIQRLLSQQFKARTIHRVYFALVHGRPVTSKGTCESHLRRHPTDRKRFASEKISPGKPPLGKFARTHFEVLKTHPFGLSLLRVQLETGRTHQIRVHMSERTHPLVGDWLYGSKAPTARIKNKILKDILLHLNRIGLHAAELGFVHPKTGKKLTFYAPWPNDLLPLLEHLGWT